MSFSLSYVLGKSPNRYISFVSIYNFKSHTFTNCDKIGYEGPTLQECRNYYNSIENIDWINNNEFYSNINGYQLWTVPESANYIINAYGTGTSNIFSNNKSPYK